MNWTLRYAPHLGFRSPDAPLFPASAGSVDPIAQIDFAASTGFAGVQDPWFATRPRETQDAIAARLVECGLAAGGIVCGSRETIRTPLWTCNVTDRSRLDEELERTIEAARRLGSRQIAVLTGADPARSRAEQMDCLISNLAWAGARAAEEGLTLCLEPTNARTLPGMLLNHFEEGCGIARATGHLAVRMIYDTAHIQSMDGDLLGHLERHFDQIAVVQIANHPGRTEPEIGEIALGHVLKRIHDLGFHGLVELEHVWSQGGLAAERRALEWLAKVDAGLGSGLA